MRFFLLRFLSLFVAIALVLVACSEDDPVVPESDDEDDSQTLTDDLVAYWNFDENFESTIGGPAYDGVPYNAPWIAPAGKFGGAAGFGNRADGDYLMIPARVINQGEDHTYSAWYRYGWDYLLEEDRYFIVETTAGNQPSSTAAYAISYGLRTMDVDADGSVEEAGQVVTMSDDGTEAFAFEGASGGMWHNILVTYSSTLARHNIYLDGELVDSMASSETLADTGGLIIGGHRAGLGRNWQGLIDEVAIWSRELTASEIAAIQVAPITATDPLENTIVLTLDEDTIPDAETLECGDIWTESGIELGFTETGESDCTGSGEGACYFGFLHSFAGRYEVWCYPARLRIDLSSVPGQVTTVRVYYTDNCGVGCTRAFLYSGGTIIDGVDDAPNNYPCIGVMELDADGANIDYLAVSSCEGAFDEIRIEYVPSR